MDLRQTKRPLEIVRILRKLSLEPATPLEAREMLALKGSAATKIGSAPGG